MDNRDLELLSAYLDGQLNSNEAARLETRINSEADLKSTLTDLRATRGILRKLPQRRAPRNFTLTRKMVGLNPPLPRSYSFFRFATAFASLLLVLTFAANILAPRLSYVGPLNTGYGGGYGGGGPVDQQMPMAAAATMAPATEAPAATEMSVATQAPAATQPPMAADLTASPEPTQALEIVPPPTATAEVARVIPTAGAAPKIMPTEISAPPSQPPAEKSALIPLSWQVALLAVVLICVAALFIIRQSAKTKWQ